MVTPKPEVGLYRIEDRDYPGNSSIVDYGLGLSESIQKWSLEKAAIGIVREQKKQKKFLTQKQAIEIGHSARLTLLKQAGTLGTAVHTHAYNLLNNIPTNPGTEDTPYYAALNAWLGQHDVQPLMMEQLLWDAVERYAGRFDFYGYVDGVLTLMDFKTNNNIHPKMGLQLVGYKHLLEAWGYEPPKQMLILHIRPNFAYPVTFVETWEMYKKVKDVFWWKFYRYKPTTYLRSIEAAVKAEQKESSGELPELYQTTIETGFVQRTGVQGHQFLQEDLEPSTKFDETDSVSPELQHTYCGQEDIQSLEKEIESSLPVQPTEKHQRGRPRKYPVANTSSHKMGFQRQIQPEEEELNPSRLRGILSAKPQRVRHA